MLAAPSGAGKNAMMGQVLDRLDDLEQLPTATTRPIREGEQEGREHFFVTRERFHEMIANHELLEWQEVHGRLYGVPRAIVEESIDQQQDRIADIDVLGATEIRGQFPENAVFIFVMPPSQDVLIDRLRDRGENADEIEVRLQRVKMELEYAPRADYIVVNDDLDRASEVLLGIILAERSRRHVFQLQLETNANAIS